MRSRVVFRRALGWLRGLMDRRRRARRYRIEHVTEEPDVLLPNRLYLVGENGHLWHATLLCPCGCGEPIALNLLPEDRPCWRVTDRGGVPSIAPSVARVRGCRSHFFLRRGKIVWWGRRH